MKIENSQTSGNVAETFQVQTSVCKCAGLQVIHVVLRGFREEALQLRERRRERRGRRRQLLADLEFSRNSPNSGKILKSCALVAKIGADTADILILL